MKTFFSYSWDSEEHQKWVVKLVNKLREEYAIDALCDEMDINSNLHRMMVNNIRTNDKFVLVITQNYTKKADELTGGVGYETNLFYNYLLSAPNKLITILKEKCELPFYLKGSKYIDFSNGITTENIEKLVRRIHDKPEYEPVPLGRTPKNISSKSADDDLIPDLRINNPALEKDYLSEQFQIAYQRIKQLLDITHNKYPTLIYLTEHTTKKATTSTFAISNQNTTTYEVYTINLSYNNKSAYVRLWLSTNDSTIGDGIFASFERPFSHNETFNSYNFGAYLDKSGKELSLNSPSVCGNKVSTGKDLGEYIYNTLMGRIK